MKKISIYILLFLLIFSTCVFANETDELKIIKNSLENKTIENYETILIPLKGDPEGFNIKPTDDLETITFGEGIAEYSVSYENVLLAVKNQETSILPYLEKKEQYHFPIIVSGREVATAEIVKSDYGYRVLCVGSGSKFDQVKDKIDITKAKYIFVPPIIDGFISEDKSVEIFTDLSSQSSPEIKNAVQTLLEKYNTYKTDTQNLPEKNTKNYMLWVCIISTCIFISGFAIIYFKRKR